MEVDLCGDVRFPRLDIVRVHRNLFRLIGILVGKAGKRVAKLMDYYGLEGLVVGHGEVVAIEDAATTIVFRVHQHDDVLVGRARQTVVERLQMERCQVAVAIERVEMASQGCVLPHSLARL